MKCIVSCIMANYNTDIEILKQSIDSILSQTLHDFEFIVVDDCSTDSSFEFLKSYTEKDERIVLLRNQKNSGLAFSLNRAIQIAKGKYIARMDSDDISLPNRFERQVDYLDRHPEIDILGSFAELFGDTTGLSFNPFVSKEECKCQLLFVPCLIHPSVMIRTDFLNKYHLQYDEKYLCSQDFDMWTRCAEHGNITMIKEILLKYRIHGTQISSKKKELQRNYAIEICKRQLTKLNITPDSNEMLAHLVLCGKEEVNTENIQAIVQWGDYLVKSNEETHLFNQKALKTIVYNRIFNLVLNSKIRKILIPQILLKNKMINYKNVYSILYRIFFIISHKMKYTG